jgi:LysM repeat protein
MYETLQIKLLKLQKSWIEPDQWRDRDPGETRGSSSREKGEKMAIRDDALNEAERLRHLFEWAGKEWGFPPALLAAIALRESACGLDLDENGLGDNGHGHGIMQIDDRSFGGLFDAGYPYFWTDPMWIIAAAAAILDAKWQYLQKHTLLEDRELTWAAVAAYNCGEGKVGRVAPQLAGHSVDGDEFWKILDAYTANHDYASQVWRDTHDLVRRGWTGDAPAEPVAVTPGQPAEPSAPPQPMIQQPAPAPQPVVQPAEAQPQTYAVQPGDSLLKISGKFYGDPGLFQKLAYYNGICDPDVIQVGLILEIPATSELSGEVRETTATAVTPSGAGVEVIVPLKLGLTPPNGLDEIFNCFGDIRKYVKDNGSLDSKSWASDALGQAVLPFAIPLSWNLGTKVQKIECHKKLVDIIPEVLAAIEKAGLRNQIKNYGGCFAFRSKRSSGKISTHSWGIAIDLNPLTNPMGMPGDMNPDIVAIFRNFGFKWGGDWPGRNHDPMHFQFCTGY